MKLKWFIPILLFAALGATQCTSTDVQELTRTGMLIAGEDQKKADTVAKSAGQVAGAVSPMDFEREREIGSGVAIDSFATQGHLYDDNGVQRYVNLVGQTVVRQSARKGFPFNFAVVESSEVNAWSAPGDFIFITTGALRRMKSEAELAGVLGHEITHVTEAHLLTMLKREQLLGAALEGSQAVSGKDVSEIRKVADAGMDTLIKKGLDQKMEYAADDSGSELAALAGYDPPGLLDYLKRLRAETGSDGGGWLTAVHPPLDTRISRLERKMTTDFSGMTGVTNEGRFQKKAGAALAN